jgi:hypothetical protein
VGKRPISDGISVRIRKNGVYKIDDQLSNDFLTAAAKKKKQAVSKYMRLQIDRLWKPHTTSFLSAGRRK